MKKKKIFMRVSAIFGAFLLVAAMALPCFAWNSEDGNVSVDPFTPVGFADPVNVYGWYEITFESTSLTQTSPYYLIFTSGGALKNTDEVVYARYNDAFYAVYSLSISQGKAVLSYYDEGVWGSGIPGTLSNLSISEIVLYYPVWPPEISGAVSGGADSTSSVWNGVTYTVKKINEAPPEPMYNILYDIFKSNIYGDVELSSDQTFVLTQMSTWLCWIVLLMPLIAVFGVVLRLLR